MGYIVNVKGTKEESPRDFNVDAEDWIEYWEKVKGKKAPKFCCNDSVQDINHDDEIVGAHVYECNYLDFISGEKVYIAPLCKSCNGKKGYSSGEAISLLSEDLMEIDSDYLVPHPKYKNKK